MKKPTPRRTPVAAPAPVPQAAPAQPFQLHRYLGITPVVQAVLLLFAFSLPLIYDLTVPEVAGDIRWTVTHAVAGACALLLLGRALYRRHGLWSGKLPAVAWFALGLLLWSATSMIGDLNVDRAFPMIKALGSQVLLGFVVAAVWTPQFGRRLVWALVLPVFFVTFLGAAQFFGWTDASLAADLPSPLGDLWGWLAGNVNVLDVLPCINDGQVHASGIVDALTGCYQQSAVPGTSFANKNLAASWTAMMVPLIAYLLLTSRRRLGRAVASLLLGAAILFLIYSRARASWVALLFGLTALGGMLVLSPEWRQLLKVAMLPADRDRITPALLLRRAAWLLPAIIMTVWQFNVTSPLTTTYAINLTPTSQMANLTDAKWDDVGGRLAYNLNSLDIVAHYPLKGVGLGSFYVIYPAYHNALVPTPPNSYSVMARPQRTHTDMMQTFDETGIPGGICYLLMFASALYAAFGLVGSRAGKTGLLLAGAGYTGLVLLVTLLLVKGGIVHGFPFGVIGVTLLLGAAACFGLWRYGVQPLLRHEPVVLPTLDQRPADTLFGLFGGIAVLTIFTNALMDFPFQLPTAPAVVAMLLGGIAWQTCHRRAVLGLPSGKGLPMPIEFGRPGVAVAFLIIAALTGVALWDDAAYRNGNQILKGAMVRIMSGITDDETLRLITAANNAYPYDPRITEHLAVTYANYQGSQPITLETRIGVLEEALKGDPWGANHLINLCGQYLQLADIQLHQGNTAGAQASVKRTHELLERLQRVAGFSHYTLGIEGMLDLLEGKIDAAETAFNAALKIEPSYTPAKAGLERIAALRHSGGSVTSTVPH